MKLDLLDPERIRIMLLIAQSGSNECGSQAACRQSLIKRNTTGRENINGMYFELTIKNALH